MTRNIVLTGHNSQQIMRPSLKLEDCHLLVYFRFEMYKKM